MRPERFRKPFGSFNKKDGREFTRPSKVHYVRKGTVQQPSYRLGNVWFYDKTYLDQVSASRPSHIYVVQVVYLSQPPYNNSTICYVSGEYLIYQGLFQIRSGTTIFPLLSIRWSLCRNLLFVF